MTLTAKEQRLADQKNELAWSMRNIQKYPLAKIGDAFDLSHQRIAQMIDQHEARVGRIQNWEKKDWDFIYKQRELLLEALKHFEDEPPC